MARNEGQISISQNYFIERIIRYVHLTAVTKSISKKIDANRPVVVTYGKRYLRNFAKKNISDGMCLGLAIVHSYMAAKGKAKWWESILKIVVQWNGNANTLNTIIAMPPGSYDEARPMTYRALLERVSSYALHYQCYPGFLSSAKYWRVDMCLRPGGLFFSEDGAIQFYQCDAGYFDEIRLYLLLNQIKCYPALEAIILICSANHACSFRYGLDRNWYLYNPNSDCGERRFIQQADLVREILYNRHCDLGQNLKIEIASWQNPNSENGLLQLESYLSEFYSSRGVYSNILKTADGFRAIANSATDQILDRILASTEQYPEVKSRFFQVLGEGDSYGYTGRENIAANRPEKVSDILHPFQKNLIDYLLNLDRQDDLCAKIRELWKETRSSNVCFFRCERTQAEIAYRTIQGILQKNSYKPNRAISVLMVLLKFYNENKFEPFAQALDQKFNLELIDKSKIQR